MVPILIASMDQPFTRCIEHESLEDTMESPDEIEILWLATAKRRFQELRDGIVEGIPAQKVFAELRSKYS